MIYEVCDEFTLAERKMEGRLFITQFSRSLRYTEGSVLKINKGLHKLNLPSIVKSCRLEFNWIQVELPCTWAKTQNAHQNAKNCIHLLMSVRI